MSLEIQESMREDDYSWVINKFLKISDSLDATRMKEIYAKNSVLQFANQEPFVGLESITSFFSAQFAGLASMKHDLISFDVVGNVIYQACNITYIVAGDPERLKIPIPGFAVLERIPGGQKEGGKLRKAAVYLDPAPLVKRIGEVKALQKLRHSNG